jgi:hypothetical protein
MSQPAAVCLLAVQETSLDGSDNAFRRLELLETRNENRLCGLVARVPGKISRGPACDSRRYQIFCVAVGLERGPLILVKINEELLEWKSGDSGLENRD